MGKRDKRVRNKRTGPQNPAARPIEAISCSPGCGCAEPTAGTTCSGYQLDHRDGSMSCTLGVHCPGVALPHRGWRDCTAGDGCDACAGRIVWTCAGG